MTETVRKQAGDKAPAFTLQDETGRKFALSGQKSKWAVVYFYPRDNTSGCTKEACEFTSLFKQFEKLDATVIGISPDSQESHRKFIEKQALKVKLLSDPAHKVMSKYGAWGTKMMYGKKHMGVIRSTFLIDPKGKIAHVWYKVKAAGHAEKVIEKLGEQRD